MLAEWNRELDPIEDEPFSFPGFVLVASDGERIETAADIGPRPIAFTNFWFDGEPAKSLAYTFTSKTDATNTGPGQWWVANHGGKQFSFRSNFSGSHQAEINAILADLAMKARMADLGMSVKISRTSAEYGAFIVDETEKWSKVVKFSGAKPD